MGRFVATPDEAAWLRDHVPGQTFDATAEQFSKAFRPVTRTQVSSWASNNHVRCGCKRHMPTIWSDELKAWLKSFVPGHEESEISAECDRLFGIALSESQISYGKKVLGVKSGTHGGEFRKGQEPWCKGKSWDEQGRSEESRKASLATCFKQGEINGYARSHKKPVGYERVSQDGYIEVKVHDGLQRKANSNFRFKHHVVWEEANGMPVPPRTNIVFADGDKTNLDPANLVAVPRDVWAVIRRSGCQFSNVEELKAQMLIAEVRMKCADVERMPRECRRCGKTFSPRYGNQRTCDACLGRE